MATTDEKSKKITENQNEPLELMQTSKTPMTADMIFSAVKKEYPSMFTDDAKLVKLVGGDVPVFETQRKVSK